MGRLFELLIALFLLIHIPITLFGDAQAGTEALCRLEPVECFSRVRTGAGCTRTTPTLSHAVLGPEWFHPRMLDVMKGYLGTYHDPLVRLRGGFGYPRGSSYGPECPAFWWPPARELSRFSSGTQAIVHCASHPLPAR